MNNNYLSHHGIKGMKWGVRRYQNKDGSLTSAGVKRYERDQLEKKGNKEVIANPNRWVAEDITRSKKIVEAGAKMTTHIKQFNASTAKNTTKAKMDLSSMSDKELRDRINRTLLEKQYNDMFAPTTKQEVTGRDYVNMLLEKSSTLMAIGSSAIGLALAIKELKG